MNITESIQNEELKEFFLLNRNWIEKDIQRNRKLCKILINNWDVLKKEVNKMLKRKLKND